MGTYIVTKPFGKTANGDPVTLYTLSSATVEVDIMDYGAAIVSIRCPDRFNNMDDIVAGFSDVKGYQADSNYVGAVIGRVCNRISKGKFSLNGQEYNLPCNNGPNSLHGGKEGFDKKMWTLCETKGNKSLKFHYTSADGEEGYPGNVDVYVKYSLKGPELLIHFSATTDKDTIINLTSHSYFNLSGHRSWNDLTYHRIILNSNLYLPLGQTSIPTGQLMNVEKTVFDLRKPQILEPERLNNVPGEGPRGYDHCFCLSQNSERKFASKVEHAENGRIMTVETTQPGVQLYTANYFDNVLGKHSVKYDKQSCFALETQNWPDAVNRDSMSIFTSNHFGGLRQTKPSVKTSGYPTPFKLPPQLPYPETDITPALIGTFPNMVLRPGKKYNESTWFTFTHTT